MHLSKTYVLLLVLTTILTMASAQNNNPDTSKKLSSAEQAVLRVEEDLFAAIKGQDQTMLDRILAEDFVYRNPGNAEVGRAEFLKLVTSSPIKILSLWGEEMKVNVFGETAIMTGLQLAKTKNSDDQEIISAGMFTDVFVKRQGRWQLILAHAVDLPQVPPQYLPKK